MLSGCQSQASRAMSGVARSERSVKVFYVASFLRHLWAAHINDRKRNQLGAQRALYSRLHVQRAAADLPETLHLARELKANLGSVCPQTAVHPPPIISSSVNSKASIGQREDPGHRNAVRDVPKSAPIATVAQLPPEMHSLREVKKSAETIELHMKWRRKWKGSKTAKRLTRRRRLAKGHATYDWRRPLRLVRNRSEPDRLPRGRLFRSVPCGDSTGQYPGLVQEPSTWSKSSFDQYVYQLAMVRPPPSPVARALNARSDTQTEYRSTRERGTILHDLMHQRMMYGFLEPKVCNVAIHFLTRHQMISKARSILLLMEHQNLCIGPSTFNIFLKAAVHQNDLAIFSWLLKVMRQHEVQPVEETRILLIQCLRSRKHKTQVIKKMRVSGTRLVNRLMRRNVISATIKQDIAGFLESGRSPTEFLAQMRRENGPGWLSTRIGNIILDQVCKRSSLPSGLSILPPLVNQGFRPDIITLNTPLYLSTSYGSLESAASILDTFATDHAIHPDHQTYQHLFQLAWDRRYLNVCLVIWISACLHGAATTKMCEKLRYSIRVNNSLLKTARTGTYSVRLDNINYRKDAHLRPKTSTPLPGRAARVFVAAVGNFVLGLDRNVHQSVTNVRGSIDGMIRTLSTARLKMRFSLAWNLREAHRLDREWRIHEGIEVDEKLGRGWEVVLVRYGKWIEEDRTQPNRVNYVL